METMGLFDIAIKYFNVIVFIMCVVFGVASVFASWIAWRELIRKKNIIRSIVAAYNITEDTIEKGQTPSGDVLLDPAIVQTVLSNLQEVLNAMYGEITGRSMPPKEQRAHGSRRLAALLAATGLLQRKQPRRSSETETVAPTLVAKDRDRRHFSSHL
jgi:hypothetical protein